MANGEKDRPAPAEHRTPRGRLPGGALLALACAVILTPEPSHTLLRPGKEACASPVVGFNRFHRIEEGETMVEVARRCDLSYGGLMAANPGVDPWVPPVGLEVVLPYAGILPGRPVPGITVNLAEMRLYFVERKGKELAVRVYPIGIAADGAETPLGEFRIVERIRHPEWTPPSSVRRERPELPPVVPPGPENPLGDYWLGLSAPGVGIHGTNKPYGIGRRVSHGCIRLYPDDIAELFPRARRGLPVRIVYRPIKAGIRADTLFAEVHRDILGHGIDLRRAFTEDLERLAWDGSVDWARVDSAVRESAGLPVPVGTRPPGERSEDSSYLR